MQATDAPVVATKATAEGCMAVVRVVAEDEGETVVAMVWEGVAKEVVT